MLQPISSASCTTRWVVVQFDVRQALACRNSGDKLKFVGHLFQTAPLPTRCQRVDGGRLAASSTTKTKGFGFPKPFLIEVLFLELTFDDLHIRRQVDFELIHRNRRIALDVREADGG